MLGEGRGSGAE